ncbi:MAG: tRNA (adenosine(37)-N6)-threonylcarbamoyltransferase complex ATPase subunit type 1 TsaE [Marinibacterium sp.]
MSLASPAHTDAFAARIGARLTAGDTLLLDGPVGAGKSHFARALVRSLQDVPEDVPSPTFTLVQVYDTRIGSVWHCDLYRLTDPEDLIELGLTDALGSAVCLIEWPDRLGALTPPDALTLRFAGDPERPDWRSVTMESAGPRWADRLPDLAA